MTKIEKRNSLINEMKEMDALAKKENRSFTDDEKKLFADKEAEIRTLTAEIEAEERASKLAGYGNPDAQTNKEDRASEFVKTGKMEIRTLLASGKIAKPTKADGINGLAEVASGIVDDVRAISLTGNGAWTAAYKKTDAKAAKVTEGSGIGGTGSTYDYVDIVPTKWGVLDEISKQVKAMTPLAYQASIEESAVIALREYASDVIIQAVLKSSLAEKRNSVKLDEKFIRGLLLNFRSIGGKGEVKLYLNQSDLATLGEVRGTNEKKPVYEIEFDGGSTLSGTIKDGGSAVKFRILDKLETGTQLFGQPMSIDMPMWDNYKIETDEGGEYFKKDLIGIKGTQMANADLVAYHGMQVIKQAAAASGASA